MLPVVLLHLILAYRAAIWGPSAAYVLALSVTYRKYAPFLAAGALAAGPQLATLGSRGGRSREEEAAVDGEDDAGDEGGVEEVEDGFGDVFGGAQAA